jgi:hypothetical protein
MLEPSDGSWRKRGDGAIIFNPSYFAPYLLKTIAEFDQKSCGKDRPSKQKPHDWQKLIDDQYELMSAILATKGLRHPEAKGTNPMPDWAVCSVIAGDFKCESYLLQTTYPEMDAIRVMIEIGHDAIINKDPRAIKFLREFLIKSGFYKKDGITPVDNFISRVKIGGDDKNKILAIAVYAVAIKGSGDPAAAANLETFKKALDEAFTVHPEDPDKGYFGNATDADQYYKQSLILMCRMLLGEK